MNEARNLVPLNGPGRSLTQYGDYLPAPTDRIDLSESVSFFRRQLKLIAAITAIVVLAGLIVSIVIGKTYRAESTVMLTVACAVPPFPSETS